MYSSVLHTTGNYSFKKKVVQVCLFVCSVVLIFLLKENIFKPNTTYTVLPATALDSTIVYSKPIVITKGGTYTGNWESKNTEIPAVDIQTSEPVIIIHSNIRSASYLIKSWGYNADITVKHTNGYGITPTSWVDFEKPRRFLALDVFRNITVENCYMENTAGIYLGVRYVGDNTPGNTIKIRYNKVKNIDGRIVDGVYRSQFVQFNFRGEVKNAEIAWNEIINEPDKSAVEDNINIFNSRGTSDSPIRIHNNYIQGAFPFPANKKEYSGGGILIDSPSKDKMEATAYVQISDNQLVGLGNHCIGIAGGNNIVICNNRAIVAAQFSDGTPFKFWTSGIWAKDYYRSNTFFENKIHHNTLAVTGQTGSWRNDLSDSTSIVTHTFGNNIIPGKIDRSMEDQEIKIWQRKLKLAGIKIGPQSPSN
jgi:hypothetical protein